MNKVSKVFVIIWAMCLLLYNIMAFTIPNHSIVSPSFWVGYVFFTIFLIGQLASTLYTFKDNDLDKLFYRVPVIAISFIGIIVACVVATFTMSIADLPIWIGIALNLIVMVVVSIIEILSASAGTLNFGIDKSVRSATTLMRTLAADSEHLLSMAKTSEMKVEVKRVYEAIRYSDSVTSMGLSEINMAVQREFAVFQEAVITDDISLVQASGSEMISLIDERNIKCKLLKH